MTAPRDRSERTSRAPGSRTEWVEQQPGRRTSLSRALGLTTLSALLPGSGLLRTRRRALGLLVLGLALLTVVLIGGYALANGLTSTALQTAADTGRLRAIMVLLVLGTIIWAGAVALTALVTAPRRPSTGQKAALTAFTALLCLAVSAPALASSPTTGCYVFDMWSSNGRQPINNNRDQISGTVRYSPNNHQTCIEDQNQPYPHNIVITVTLDPATYTGEFKYNGPGGAVAGANNSVVITLPFTGLNPGSSHQWNLQATTRDGVTRESAQFKAHIEATSYPDVTWKIIEGHDEWMSNRTPLSYDY